MALSPKNELLLSVISLRKYELNNNKSKHGTFNKSHKRRKDTKSKKGMRHRDAFRPCSRVSSGGRTGKETNSKSRTEEKSRFHQQRRT